MPTKTRADKLGVNTTQIPSPRQRVKRQRLQEQIDIGSQNDVSQGDSNQCSGKDRERKGAGRDLHPTDAARVLLIPVLAVCQCSGGEV